jgi:hypothetical protein
MKNRTDFYDSEEWMRLRYQALKAHKGRCECCGAQPGPGNPLHVDHIKPRSRYPRLALDITNLQVLCKKCNLGKGASDDTDWRPPAPPSVIGTGSRWQPLHADKTVPLREALLLGAVLNHPWLLTERAEDFAALLFTDSRTAGCKNAILEFCATGEKITRSSVRNFMSTNGLDGIFKDIDTLVKRYPGAAVGPERAPAEVHVWWMCVVHCEGELRQLNAQLREVETALGLHPSDEHFAKLTAIKRRLGHFEEVLKGQKQA